MDDADNHWLAKAQLAARRGVNQAPLSPERSAELLREFAPIWGAIMADAASWDRDQKARERRVQFVAPEGGRATP
jgi:hypothetical protein